MEVVGVCAVDEFVGGVHGDGEKVGTEQELRGVGQESETGVHCVGLRAFYRALATSSLQNSPSLPCTRNIYSLTTSRLPLLVIPLSFPYSYYPNSFDPQYNSMASYVLCGGYSHRETQAVEPNKADEHLTLSQS